MPGSKQNSQVSVLDSGLRHPPSPWEQIPEPREGGDTILGTSPESREVTAEAARSLCPYGASAGPCHLHSLPNQVKQTTNSAPQRPPVPGTCGNPTSSPSPFLSGASRATPGGPDARGDQMADARLGAHTERHVQEPVQAGRRRAAGSVLSGGSAKGGGTGKAPPGPGVTQGQGRGTRWPLTSLPDSRGNGCDQR